jgi:hypothetical protein
LHLFYFLNLTFHRSYNTIAQGLGEMWFIVSNEGFNVGFSGASSVEEFWRFNFLKTNPYANKCKPDGYQELEFY